MQPFDSLYLAVSWTVMGLFVGSFLNVCIHRFPLEDETPSNPRRSRCPRCKHTLSWRENIPLVSWIVQRGRCRHCSARISPRYPLIEGLNACLWWIAVSRAGPDQVGLWVTWSVVLSGLLVATAVDCDCYQIPDEVSIGGILLGVVACLAVPELHADSMLALHLSDLGSEGVDRVGSLLTGIAGMGTGAAVLCVIGWLGKRIYGVEAMGWGDVKLLAAGGAFVGPAGALLALVIAALLGSIFGLVVIVRFFILTRSRALARGRWDPVQRSIRVARLAGRYVAFGPFLAIGVGITLMYWDDVSGFLP